MSNTAGIEIVGRSKQTVRFSAVRRELIVSISLSFALWMQLSGCGLRFAQERSTAVGTEKDYRFTSGTSALRIPFEEDEGHIFFQVRINDSAPLWFGLDTGAVRSIIDQRFAQTLGLRAEGNQRVGGAGGSEEASIIKGVSIKLPGVELYNQTVWGLPLEALSAANSRETAGIIGYELFSHFVVETDFTTGFINLCEPQSYRYQGPGESIPVELQNGEIYVTAKVEVPDHKPIEGQFVIDTGSNNTLMLAKRFVAEHKLLESVGPTFQARGGGVGGEIQMAIGRTKSLQLGSFVIRNPISAFINVGEIAEPGRAGNIGGRLLRRFRVIFDYSRKRMILEPTSRLTEAEEFDMSGAALMSEAPSFSVIKIFRVRSDSPAAKAGLQQQDTIIAVDGQPATALGVSKIRKMFRIEGREYLLTVKRGEEVLKIAIKMKRLI